MAEMQGNGKQPPTRRKPSGLRHELRPDSTDDERETKKHIVQVPHSDTVVPETQPDHEERFNNFSRDFDNVTYYGDDVPLSPNSLAVLERTAVTKKPEVLESTSFTVRLLSKEAFSKGESSASSTTPTFSFGQARKDLSRSPPKEEVAAPQPIAHASLTSPPIQQPEEQVPNDSSVIAPPAVHPQPETSEHAQQDAATGDTPDPNKLLPPSVVSSTSYHQDDANNLGSTQVEAAAGLPPSAQPIARPIIGTKKIRTVKKRKKSTKGLLPQPRGGPWPPRPSNIASHADQATVIDDHVPETFADPRDLSHTEPQDDRVPDIPEDDMWRPSSLHGVQDDTYGYTANAPHVANQTNAQYTMQPFNTESDMPPTMSQQALDTPAQSVYPTTPRHASLQILVEPSPIEPGEQWSKVAYNQAAAIPHEDVVYEKQHARLIPQEPEYRFPTQINGTVDNVSLAARLAQPEVEMETGRPAPQSRIFEAALHGASDRGGPHRVEKPRRRPGPVSGPLPHDMRMSSMPLDTERCLENLRAAMMADNFRMQHEHTMTTKQNEERTALLKETVGLQNNTIAEYKQKHQNLDGALTRLTDKAKTNQRYVTGLQRDYEKLQKSVKTFQDQSKKDLRAKIAEIENEKDSLRREFEATTDVLAKSQKNMRKMVEDLYIRLTLSDSKKRDLAENLRKQEAMYQEERRKRDEFEKQLLSGVQNMQRQLGDSSITLVDKLELLQSSVNKVSANDDRHVEIKECLTVLRSLQSTPFLTSKDVQKAEGLLRFVHERVDSGFGAISGTLKCKPPPDTELQDFIKQQLQNLQKEMWKYEDVVAENRKAHKSNDTLKKQLEAQHQHCSYLDEQIKALQLTEVDLTAHSTQLERDLNDLKDMSHDPETEPSELERGMMDLRQQLRKAEEDLQAANTRIEEAEQVRQELEQDGARVKKMYETARAHVFSIGEIHNEKVHAQQKLRNDLDAANNQLDQLSKKNKTLEFDLNAVRKEQLVTEAKLKAAQQSNPSRVAEMTNLEEQLRQKQEELKSKARDYADLERQFTDMSNKATHVQGLHNQLQAQLAQQFPKIENTRQEADRRISEVRQDAQDTLQHSQDQASTLQQEKQSLLSRLEQARSNEAKLNNAQAAFSTEREKLHQRLIDIRTANEGKEADLIRIQADTTEQNRKLTEKHRTEIDDWSRRLTQTDAALKEAEAKLRLSDDQFQAKLASDRKKAEENLLQVEQKYKIALQAATKQSALDQQRSSQSSVVPDNPSTALQNIHAGKARKKLSRHNNSLLNITGTSTASSGTHTSKTSSIIFRTKVPQTQRERTELSPNLFDEQLGVDDVFDDENDLSIIDHDFQFVPETQEVGSLSMLQEVFDERLAQASHHEAERQNLRSTDLSSIGSEDLSQMQKDVQSVSTPMLRGHDHISSKPGSSQLSARETPVRSDNNSVAGSLSSQSLERPRSQANMASRMMPPPDNVSHHFQSRNQAQGSSAKVSSRHGVLDKTSQKFSSSGTSTPDFMHPPSSVSKQTYSQHDSRNFPRNEPRQSTPRAMEQSRTEKRKSSTSQTERETAMKKQRTSSQAYSVVPSSASRNYSPYISRASAVGSRSKTHAGPAAAYAQGASSTNFRSKTPASSSNIQPRTSSHVPSSSDAYSSRRQQPSSSQIQAAAPMRRTSSRITRSTSRVGTAFEVEDRFEKELRGR